MRKTSTLYAALAPRDFTEGLLVRSLPGTFESWFTPRPITSYNAFPNAFLRPLLTLRPELRYVIGALEAAGELPLDVKPLDNHIAWISRALAARAAA